MMLTTNRSLDPVAIRAEQLQLSATNAIEYAPRAVFGLHAMKAGYGLVCPLLSFGVPAAVDVIELQGARIAEAALQADASSLENDPRPPVPHAVNPALLMATPASGVALVERLVRRADAVGILRIPSHRRRDCSLASFFVAEHSLRSALSHGGNLEGFARQGDVPLQIAA